MPDELTKSLTIASSLAEAHRAQETIIADVQAAGFSDEAVFAVRLALDEALSNAVKHGNQFDDGKVVAIRYDLTDDGFVIEITDEGPGFNPDDVPDPTLDENIEKPHGRGLMLMRAYMTDVQFSECGKTVRLVKNRDCPLPLRSRTG